MKKFFSNLVGLFTQNWWLKLLALALAIVIYHSLKPSNNQKIRSTETQNDRTLFHSR